jgi:hypothetical protein
MSSKEFANRIFAFLHGVNRDKRLNAVDAAVAMELSDHFTESDQGGRAYPGCKTMGDKIGLHETTVIRSVHRLQDAGHIRVVWGSPGRGHPHQYWMAKPAPAQVKKPAPAQVSKPENLRQRKRKPAPAQLKPAPAQENHVYNHVYNHEENHVENHEGESQTPPPAGASKKASKKVAGESKKRKAKSAAKPETDLAESFAKFWAAYPLQVGVDAARSEFDKAVKRGADPDAIITAAKAYALVERQRIASGGLERHTQHPKNWLRDGRYKDAPPAGTVIDQQGNPVAIEQPQPQQRDRPRSVTEVGRAMIEKIRRDGSDWDRLAKLAGLS